MDLISEIEFDSSNAKPSAWEDDVFIFCTFENLDLEGFNFDGIMSGCSMKHVQFYWGLFNTAHLNNVKFANCDFLGTSFKGTCFTNCVFENCNFKLDNLDGQCLFEECILAECNFKNCSFEHTERTKVRIFPKSNRLYGCKTINCDDFDAKP